MQLPSPSSTVILKELNDGAVLYCNRTEVYFGLNEVGLAIWQALPSAPEPSDTFDTLTAALAVRFPEVTFETIRGDAREFLEALAHNELVTSPVGTGPGSVGTGPGSVGTGPDSSAD